MEKRCGLLPRANLMSIKKIQRDSFLPSILLTDSFLVSAGEALDRGAKNSGGTGPVCLVYLVCFVDLVDLVHPVSFVQPNKQDKPN